jgi:hypothetical protein
MVCFRSALLSGLRNRGDWQISRYAFEVAIDPLSQGAPAWPISMSEIAVTSTIDLYTWEFVVRLECTFLNRSTCQTMGNNAATTSPELNGSMRLLISKEPSRKEP